MKGYRVGVLDIDLTGPSMPRMLGLEGRHIHQSSAGWIPVYLDSTPETSGKLSCMSIGFLLRDRGDSVVWRGPKKGSMIGQFVEDVVWGDLDYLLIDTPPGIPSRRYLTRGTSDEHITILEKLRDHQPDGAVLVTTPQAVALADVRKELNFCRKVHLPILGVIENMSGFVCPHCSECTNIFSTGGGEAMALEFGVAFLGRAPIDPNFVLAIERNQQNRIEVAEDGSFEVHGNRAGTSRTIVDEYKDLALSDIFKGIVEKLIEEDNEVMQEIS
jgi:Mrp family chromosome partitioning ATPase